jgi:hypothetical protein
MSISVSDTSSTHHETKCRVLSLVIDNKNFKSASKRRLQVFFVRCSIRGHNLTKICTDSIASHGVIIGGGAIKLGEAKVSPKLED